jgi:hypothetical protein
MSDLKFLYYKPKDIDSEDYHHTSNIISASANVFKKFKKNQEVVVIAEMQSGKTEIMRRMIYVVKQFNNKLRKHGICIDKHNIHIILSASSLQLKEQLRSKLPEVKHNVMHLNDLNAMVKNLNEYESNFIQMSDSSLIIFDECHCDVEIGKTIDKFRGMLKTFSKQNKTKYYVVSSSASPYEQINVAYPKVIMRPGQNYYGLRDMIEADVPVIFPSKKLYDKNECVELFKEIDVCNFYYIFRLTDKPDLSALMMSNIETEFNDKNVGIDTIIYDMSYKESINELITSKPDKPTIIYLKDKLRMGEFLDTTYVYMVHDDPQNQYTHTTIQSLVGRCCGYNKKKHKTIIYCDYDKVLEHYTWLKKNYDPKYIPTHAKYINKSMDGNKDICIY